MAISNKDLAEFVADHDTHHDTSYLRASIDKGQHAEFLRFGGELYGQPVLLVIQAKDGKRKRVEHGTGCSYVDKYPKGVVRAWRRLPYMESSRAVRRELLDLFSGSKKVEIVAATAIWSTPMA